MQADGTSTFLFLSGADMDPTAVRVNHPNARFVARGFVEARAGQIAPAFAKYVASPGTGDVWGILIESPDTVEGDPLKMNVTADDGRTFDAVIVGERMISGQTHATLAAALYWELPPGYTGRLKMATPKLGTSPGGDDE